MGSARDSAPELRRAGSPVCPAMSARAHLHPASAIAPIRRSSNGSPRPQPPRRGSPSLPPATRSGIASPPISGNRAPTSVPCRSVSTPRTSKRRGSPRTCSTEASWGPAVQWMFCRYCPAVEAETKKGDDGARTKTIRQGYFNSLVTWSEVDGACVAVDSPGRVAKGSLV